MSTCSECRRTLPQAANYCCECGLAVVGAKAVPAQQRQHNRMIIWVIVAVLIMLAVAALKGIGKVIDAFLDGLSGRNTSAGGVQRRC